MNKETIFNLACISFLMKTTELSPDINALYCTECHRCPPLYIHNYQNKVMLFWSANPKAFSNLGCLGFSTKISKKRLNGNEIFYTKLISFQEISDEDRYNIERERLSLFTKFPLQIKDDVPSTVDLQSMLDDL